MQTHIMRREILCWILKQNYYVNWPNTGSTSITIRKHKKKKKIEKKNENPHVRLEFSVILDVYRGINAIVAKRFDLFILIDSVTWYMNTVILFLGEFENARFNIARDFCLICEIDVRNILNVYNTRGALQIN